VTARPAAASSRRRPGPDLTIQRASRARHIPSDAQVRRWARAALARPAQVTVRYVAEAEGRRLNREFRGKDYATNVLTFVYEGGKGLAGDVVICAPVVAREARGQGKALGHHHAHLLVHGLLHLQGMDHQRSEREARRMEARERAILRRLGLGDPYA
jgi:probable rRNA maturation factor